jgi:hypothetical protein
MGSTGWLASLLAGARGIAAATAVAAAQENPSRRKPERPLRMPRDAAYLCFTVREPFPSKTTGISMVFGRVTVEKPLMIESHMPERGVIFSDGIEADFIEFNVGSKVTIAVADRHGVLVV